MSQYPNYQRRNPVARCALLSLSIAALIGACDRSSSEPAPSSREATAAPAELEWVKREIAEYRVQLRTPPDWTIEKSKTKPFHSVSAPRAERRGGLLRLAQVAVGLQPGVPSSLEDAAGDCDGEGKAGGEVLVSEKLPSGAYFVFCKRQVLDHPHGNATAILPIEGGQSVHCVGSGRGDLELEKEVCRSLSSL